MLSICFASYSPCCWFLWASSWNGECCMFVEPRVCHYRVLMRKLESVGHCDDNWDSPCICCMNLIFVMTKSVREHFERPSRAVYPGAPLCWSGRLRINRCFVPSWNASACFAILHNIRDENIYVLKVVLWLRFLFMRSEEGLSWIRENSNHCLSSYKRSISHWNHFPTYASQHVRTCKLVWPANWSTQLRGLCEHLKPMCSLLLHGIYSMCFLFLNLFRECFNAHVSFLFATKLLILP